MKEHEIAKFSSALQNMLAKIGRTNGHGPPDSQDPVDEALHHLFVDKVAANFFKKRIEADITRVKELGGDRLREKIEALNALAKKYTKKQEGLLLQAKHYSLSFEAGTPAARFSQERLVIELSKLGWTKEKTDELIERCKVRGEPSQSFNAVQSREDE